MTKLAILEDLQENKYDHITTLRDWRADPKMGADLPNAVSDPYVKSLVDAVMNSLSSARQSEVKAWEEEIAACEHTLMLEQLVTSPIPASGELLWLL